MQDGAVSSRSGFTLLELTVALAMVAVLGVSLYTSMAIAFRARTSAQMHTQVVREATIALDVLRQELESVLPPGGVLAGPFLGLSAGPDDLPMDSVEFHALGRDPVDQLMSEGARWVQIALVDAGDGRVLVRRVERNLLATLEQAPADEVLLSNVRSLGLRYFDGFDWHQEWDSTQAGDSLPLAVELILELDSPAPADQERFYRVQQVIPLSSARPDLIDQAAGGGSE